MLQHFDLKLLNQHVLFYIQTAFSLHNNPFKYKEKCEGKLIIYLAALDKEFFKIYTQSSSLEITQKFSRINNLKRFQFPLI